MSTPSLPHIQRASEELAVAQKARDKARDAVTEARGSLREKQAVVDHAVDALQDAIQGTGQQRINFDKPEDSEASVDELLNFGMLSDTPGRLHAADIDTISNLQEESEVDERWWASIDGMDERRANNVIQALRMYKEKQ